MGASSKTRWSMQQKCGGLSACRKLESAQMKMGRRLLGANNRVAGVVVQRDLGWRRDEMKVVVSKILKVWKRAD